MLLPRFEKIKTFIFDVDGVLTDSTLLLMDDGSLVRRMNVKDGYAIRVAINAGYQIIIITGGNSLSVKKRLNDLGVSDIFLQTEDKQTLMQELLDKGRIVAEQTLYMGDDIIDLGAMSLIALPTAPMDAVTDVKSVALYVSPFSGGQGCVRDVIEKVLKIQGVWPQMNTVSGKGISGLNE